MNYGFGRTLLSAAAGLVLAVTTFTGTASAQTESKMAGKKVIFVPISMGISLTEGWARRMREHAEIGGYSFEVRDAAFNTGVMSELLAKAISDKPDVLVVHNPTVQLLARQIKQAEADGILRPTLNCYEHGAIQEGTLTAFNIALEQFHNAVADRKALLGMIPPEPVRQAPRPLAV